MKILKIVFFIILTIIVFNICFILIESVGYWLDFYGFFIDYWSLIPSAAVLLITIIKFWLFGDQSIWILFIAFLFNLLICVSYGYYLHLLRAENVFYIGFDFFSIILATGSALLQCFIVSLVCFVIKRRIKRKKEYYVGPKPSGIKNEGTLKQKNWLKYIGITIIIFHAFFFLVIFLTNKYLISGSNAHFILSPIIPIIIMALIKWKYFKDSNPWLFALGFLANFILWLSGAFIRYLFEWNFLSSTYSQVAIISTLSALGLSLAYSLILWLVRK